jgi:hypothetical protein
MSSQIKTKFIEDNAVTNAKLAQIPALSIKGNSSGSTGNASDLSVAQVNTILGDILANGTVPFTADQSLGGNRITNAGDPVGAQDLATKSYTDAAVAALNPEASVYAASTTNLVGTYNNGSSGVGATFTITATGAFTLDGTTPPANTRILIKDQSSGFQNGVYTLTTAGSVGVSPVLTRATDYNTPALINAAGLIPVINGTVNALTSWSQTSPITTIGVDALTYEEFTANPSLYLLKANNLNDVASRSVSFDNLSPMTTGGDLIYGGASGTGTRLPNGSSGQILTSNGGTSAPSWSTPAASSLTNAHIFVGNVSNVSTDVPVSGDLTLINTGAFTIVNNAITNSKIANATIDLTTKVTGILPVANGGTNLSSTTINQLLYSSANNVIAGLPTANSSVLVTDASGVPSISNQLPAPLGINIAAAAGTTLKIKASADTSAGNLQLVSAANGHTANFYIANNGFFYLSAPDNSDYILVQSNTGNLAIGGTGSPDNNTSVTVSQGVNQVQLAVRGNSTQTHNLQIWENSSNAVLASVDQNGNFSVNSIVTTGSPINIASGGTNSSTALNNNRIMVSSGGAIVEAAALTNGQLLIGSTGAAPVAANITAGTGISISNGAGSITVNNSFVNSTDIATTSFSAANNQSSAANVTGLAFSNSTVRAFQAEVSVTVIATSNLYEFFTINGIQRGADWQITYSSTGDVSGFLFSITNAGQIQYTDSNYSGFTSATLKFRADTLPL